MSKFSKLGKPNVWWAALLFAASVGTVAVSIFNRSDLPGIPPAVWYQFLCIAIGALVTGLLYSTAAARRQPVRRGRLEHHREHHRE